MNAHKELSLEKQTADFIEWLSKFGENSDGGVTRLLYTDCWIETQEALKNLIKEKGFEAYYDEVGNLFARLEGSDFKKETILTGSHIDTVVNGGKLDGQLGIIGGIIAMEYLRNTYGQPLRNIEVVAMAEEEGSRFPFTFWGSKNIVGSVDRETMEELKDEDGIGFIEAMHKAGFDFKNSKVRDDLKAFIELHIEQGGVLEIEQKSIGIVEHIVGQKRYMIEVEGEANHAGTTPMGYRKDALHGTSKMISEIMDLAISYGDPLVATVGKVEVVPNTTNVVPGKVIFSLDVRHTQKDAIIKFTNEVTEKIEEISKKMNLKTTINNYMDGEPVPMDSNLVNIIKGECETKGLNYKLMHSGAGHDSQIFAEHIPTALIFVPSHKGISHNPAEFTKIEDLTEGIKVLIDTLYNLAYK
ncbi:allantoate deiminase [Tissierella praeacuta DSM 18095]|uniref:Allantoate deiminase n=1 Tax=Tissierella praeacuta DSM 18095 TaxID=1123404 RepID=A0A1M4WLY1_9FIRM|nr:allantoate deiminase [Tissierella praeacuta]TCU79127.1 allantoate deiminase [Tissierella praeacuta]SHE82170.1 allantoate deiminase [Tissierella praeacuta DSM 18095]SUO99315.1 Allantoate amidohydrolase [Tissierella praeacuta]